MVTTAVGYASSSNYGAHFGLGKVDKLDKVEFRWPSGKVQVLKDVGVNRVIHIKEQ